MKVLIIILLSFLSLTGRSQYSLSWIDSTNAKGVTSFDIQQSQDKVNWATVGSVTATHNLINPYSFVVPGPTSYYRVRVNGQVQAYSNSVLVYNVLPVTITNWGIQSNKASVTIYWTSQNETNLKSYEIDRSYDGANFTMVSLFTPKGNSAYAVTINRPTTTTTTGFWWWKKTTTAIDSRKGIYMISAIDIDSVKTILKTVSE